MVLFFFRFDYVIALKKLYNILINRKLQFLKGEEKNAIAAIYFTPSFSIFVAQKSKNKVSVDSIICINLLSMKHDEMI